MSVAVHPASFRDPSGFVFRCKQGDIHRQVNQCYAEDYRKLMEGGLYKRLVAENLLIEHEEVSLSHSLTDNAFRVIRPRQIPFISYPYEWSFSALKDAALLTLDIQLKSMDAGMSLKDASSFNVQFEGSRPVFIDTLSFETYPSGRPWSAYGQFCRHFLAPLALMAMCDVRHGRLLSLYLDGVPLDLASSMLPTRTRLQMGLLIHLHMHATMTRRYGESSESPRREEWHLSPERQITLLQNLRKTVSKLKWNPGRTEWNNYYANTSYTDESFAEKEKIVANYLSTAAPRMVWDLGANTGTFSRMASDSGAFTCAFDIDAACVEATYRECKEARRDNLLPLVLDMMNPSPANGWAHQERESVVGRGPADVVIALALVHHLAIANNVPLTNIASHLSQMCNHLIIEFVPKHDPQVKRLLRSRPDIFHEYDRLTFEARFQRFFTILERKPVDRDSDGRVIYLFMKR